MTTYSQSIDNVGAAVAEVIQPYLVDITFTDFALLAILEEKGKVVMPDPSYDISWPVVVAKLATGSYMGLKKFPGQEKQVFDRAVVKWKNLYSDVVVSGPDALRARGPYAAFQLTDGLKQAARMSIADIMGSQIYGDGTGTDQDGLAIIIDDGVLYSTYAGLSRTSYAGWKGYTDSTGGAFTLPYFTTLLGKATIGNDSPDLVSTTQDIWNTAQNRAQAQQIFDKGNQNNNVAALGFRVINHLGANLVHDSHVAATYMWGLNTEYIELAVMPDRVWAWTGWEKIPGSDGFEAEFLFMGNFKGMSPRMFFKASNVS